MNYLRQKLKKWFGFDDFRPGQFEVLSSLSQGENTFGMLPTGTGKTLIYQFFGRMINQPVVIISPLISLMQDQVDRMRYLGSKKTVAITSGLNFVEKKRILNNLNKYNYIYISPEMISQIDVLKNFNKLDIGLFVIDEAHCIIQWGTDFRPEYLNLHRIIQSLNNPQVLMLTATASKTVRSEIVHKLGLHNVKYIVKSTNRSNIMLSVKYCDDTNDKNNKLLSLVNKLCSPGIIYFSSKKMANMATIFLRQKAHLKVEAYHSDLNNENRYRIQHQFMNDQIDVICATSAFGMGIDKSNIRYVIHYHMPSNIESYVQEMGRAGRDMKESISVILYQKNDEMLQYNLLMDNIPDDDIISFYYRNYKKIHNDDEQTKLLKYYYDNDYSEEKVISIFKARRLDQKNSLAEMLSYVLNNHCRRKKLLSHFDEKFSAHNEYCCDGDHTKLNLYAANLIRSNIKTNNKHNYDWNSIINSLFNKMH
ncbi:RecQ family ATP-dependent DNA helicase [Apilactobacillus timberlakei]|uniref:RecQ family ATP-dependent DNA helicase n=1 Tax=Apilactobacillus timberlakei TaxID=2008380 RepID=UPI00112D6350|nr:RecQ family ATP-dependent DNA helicase [Apilactobacillus timberlakei]TPR17496.1 ATP-dependent DNA helicase RecQ [Apilactobacillus timberlakei]